MRATRLVRLLLAMAVAPPALVLTASRWVSLDGSTGIALQAFSPLAVPVYAAALALLLVPLGGHLGRRVLVPVGSGLLVCLLASALVVAPRWVGDASADGADRTVVVMTANLRLGKADPAAVVRVVRAEDVDVLVLEEVTPALRSRLEEAGLADLLPHVAGQAAPGASGTLVYAREAISDVVPIATNHHSWAFTVGGLRMLGVHPAYPYSAAWRADQDLLVAAARRERPDVVLGDHNSGLDNPPFRALLDTGLRDAAEESGAGWQPTWPTDGSRGLPAPLAAIDHVLVGEDLEARATRVHDIPGTDHRALVAELAVRGG